jgi:hypothetical protein
LKAISPRDTVNQNSMHNSPPSWLQVALATQDQRTQLAQQARRRRWGPALMLIGWLHLLAFSLCYYLTVIEDYHGSTGYLLIWLGELCGMGLIFRLCRGPQSAVAAGPLETVIRRVWIAYFILAFDLGSLNTLRGHRLFEFFPAMATLASFAFLIMTVVVHRRFFPAGLTMFAAGLLMAAHLQHAYLIFALAWWLVLNSIGLTLWLHLRHGHRRNAESIREKSDLESFPLFARAQASDERLQSTRG